ncbi:MULTISPECIES: type II toxin-antitoxin system HicA family toxin [Dyadobacter]|uniref:type II toxin-antitoxin system HicA family toxin n=1 Tax=Dyadobacter TaxID=120831 RepID=UPI0028607C9E|nr:MULTISPECIES: type II toxin-antitoxin system HicA family toxin [Dyadobacter]MDR7215134.1 putative RNA binding protein YcfA (HicA-like mRNA interferase family) [Dyadobacter sp. BE31]
MGNNRPVKLKDWIRFLEAHGCKHERHSSGSHDHWKCPGCWRTITHRIHLKEIPPMHLKTNLVSMGKTLEYLYDWIEKN